MTSAPQLDILVVSNYDIPLIQITGSLHLIVSHALFLSPQTEKTQKLTFNSTKKKKIQTYETVLKTLSSILLIISPPSPLSPLSRMIVMGPT